MASTKKPVAPKPTAPKPRPKNPGTKQIQPVPYPRKGK